MWFQGASLLNICSSFSVYPLFSYFKESFLNDICFFSFTMKFCTKCGSLMMPKKEKNSVFFECSCGFTDKKSVNVILKEEVKVESKDVGIASDTDETLPQTDVDCPKCGGQKAYFWLVQTRAGDEPETKFLKCVSCKHTWRDYS